MNHRMPMLLGQDASTRLPVEWDPSPASGTANPHVMIVGESGYGKTYAIQCLLTELVQCGKAAVVFDYAQGFVGSAVHPAFIRLSRPLEILASTRGININPLRIASHDSSGPVNVAVRVSDTFARIYNIGIQQHSLLRDLILETFESSGITKDKPRTWHLPMPSLNDVHRRIQAAAEDRERTDYRLASTLRSHLSTFFIFQTFRRSGQELSWDVIFGGSPKCYIIQLNGLEDKTEKAVTEFLLWDLYNFLRGHGPSSLRMLCVLDEAHKLAFDKNSPVERLLREARKFGVGLILSSQQPEDFSRVAHSNTATKIVFHTSDRRGLLAKAISAAAPDLGGVDEVVALLNKLPRAQALYVRSGDARVVDITGFEGRTTVRQRLAQLTRR